MKPLIKPVQLVLLAFGIINFISFFIGFMIFS